MANGEYEFQSDYFKNIIAKHSARAEAKGEARGRAQALLTLLQARGLRVSDEARARISSCTDGGQLDVWIRGALTVASVDELFWTHGEAH
ncbi:MAG: hypothetical protein FWD17_17390 [Polyangiaceae bacterium]|nr:hypothetical protein [Polyangiaceae bacterium]